MLRGFSRDEIEADEERREMEFTLGPAMLLALGLGLILLCIICFGIGYSAGRRSSSSVVVSQTASGQTVTTTTAGTLSKPSASSTIQAAPAQPAPGDPAAVTAAAAASNPLTSYGPATPTNGEPTQPAGSALVRPAIPPQNMASPPASPSPTKVEPAIPQGAAVMVQVAAVSHPEDATVLVAALRRRGYAATERHEPGDNLIHVQVGPFNSRSDANAMCQRLLGDGYNASILP